MDLKKLRQGVYAARARAQAAKQAAAALIPPPVDTAMWAAGDVVQRRSARSPEEFLGKVVAVTPSPPGMPPTLHVQFGYVLFTSVGDLMETVAEGSSHRGRVVHAMEKRERCVAVYADDVFKVHLHVLHRTQTASSRRRDRRRLRARAAVAPSPPGTKSAVKAKPRWPWSRKPVAKPVATPVATPVAKPVAKKKKRKRRAGVLAKLSTEGSRWQRQMKEMGHRMRVKKQARHENYASHDKYAFKTVTLADMIGSNRAIDEDIRANTV